LTSTCRFQQERNRTPFGTRGEPCGIWTQHDSSCVPISARDKGSCWASARIALARAEAQVRNLAKRSSSVVSVGPSGVRAQRLAPHLLKSVDVDRRRELPVALEASQPLRRRATRARALRTWRGSGGSAPPARPSSRSRANGVPASGKRSGSPAESNAKMDSQERCGTPGGRGTGPIV
jgi:hypothetical protein